MIECKNLGLFMKKLVIFLLFLIFITKNVYAGQSNISITPPPIVSPSFTEGKGDVKFGISYLTMEDDGSLAGTKIDITGAGLNMIARHAFSNYIAGDFSLGVFSTSGDIETSVSTTKQEAANVNLSLNLELQPFKNDVANLIVFFGPTLTAVNGTMKTTGLINYSTSYSMALYGLQVGAQVGIKTGPVSFIPFIMSSTMQGDMTAGGYTTNIDAFTTTSYGLEIMFFDVVSLSSIIQEADKSSSNESGLKTNIYQLSFKMNF